MMDHSPLSARFRILSGSALKVIAMVVMLIDHIGAFLLVDYAPARETLFTLLGNGISVYTVVRAIGRMAFPIYCFLLIEGFLHTRNRRRYGIGLALFALISEIPWNYVQSGELTYAYQNVYVTLLLGFCGLCILDVLRSKPVYQCLGVCAILVLAYFIKADYGTVGVGFILLLYMLREHRLMQAIAAICCLSGTWKAGLAFLPISLYNGKRGFIRGWAKYLFYAFYPIHLLLLGVIRFH